MAILLQATEDTVGTPKRVNGPCSIFCSGDLGGGSVVIEAARGEEDSGSALVETHTFSDLGAVNDNIVGPHWLKATLSGATAPDVKVATN